MSFPRYPQYKDSGVDWLGQVPAHWEVKPLGRVTLEKCDGPFGSGLKSDHYVDAGVRVVRLQNIRGDGFAGTDEAFINEEYFRQELSRHEVREGDVLIAGLGDDNNTVGRACVAPAGIEPAMVKADCFRFRIDRKQARPEFVAVQLTAGAPTDAGILASGSTRSRIPLSLMASRKIALPPLPEQRQIAAFLDRETGKIDALVAEQKRLLELLKEKRQAVISHAVTRGLPSTGSGQGNPKAPLKPSGLPWLGDVPAHWKVARIKTLASRISKGTTPTTIGADFTSSGIRFLKAENITEKGVLPEPEFYISEEAHEELRRSSLAPGDVLVVIAGATTGKSAVLDADFLPANTNQAVSFVRPTRSEFGGHINRWLATDIVRRLIALNSVQSAQPNLSMEDLGNIPIPVPPLAELGEIQAHLDAATAQFDALTAEVERALALLQERRTALISAAVTGQIDVRSAAA